VRLKPPVADIDRFAALMRATRRHRGTHARATEAARRGSQHSTRAGLRDLPWAHELVTAPGTKINGGTFAVPPALPGGCSIRSATFSCTTLEPATASKSPILEHHGRKFAYMQERMSPTANRIRTRRCGD